MLLLSLFIWFSSSLGSVMVSPPVPNAPATNIDMGIDALEYSPDTNIDTDIETVEFSLGYKSINRAQFDFDPFKLTNVAIQCGKKSPSDPLFGCALGFNWEDPNSSANCSCVSTWQWDGITSSYDSKNNNYTVNYVGCLSMGAESFNFKIQDMANISAIRLMLFRRWYDGKDFQPARLTNMFALTNVTLSVAPADDPSVDMTSNFAGPLEAPINGLSI